jgi:hypothetical protein
LQHPQKGCFADTVTQDNCTATALTNWAGHAQLKFNMMSADDARHNLMRATALFTTVVKQSTEKYSLGLGFNC